MKLHLSALALAVALVSGPALAQDAAAPAEATAPAAAVVPGAIEAPPAGMGQVVFFRPSKFAGAAVSYKVRTGEGLQTVVGNMSNGVYFTFQGAPGSYQFSGATESKDAITVEIEDGETTFVEGGLAIGIVMGRPDLKPSSKEAFEKALKGMKPAKK